MSPAVWTGASRADTAGMEGSLLSRSALLAPVFALIALTLLVTLVLGLAVDSETFVLALIRTPGQILLNTFHLPAFAIPLYFLLAALVAWRRSLSLMLLRRATALTPALLCLSAVARLLDPTYPEAGLQPLVGFLGQPGAVAVLAALGAVWTLVVVLWPPGPPDGGAATGSEQASDGHGNPAHSPRIGRPDLAALPSPSGLTEGSSAEQTLAELEALSARGHRRTGGSRLAAPEPGAQPRVLSPPEVEILVSDIPEAAPLEYRNGDFYEIAEESLVLPADQWEAVEDQDPEPEVLDERDELDERYQPAVPDERDELDVPEALDEPDELDSAAEPVPEEAGRLQIAVHGVLADHGDTPYWVVDDETRAAAQVLQETLEEFRISAEVTGIRRGPVITMFEILPAPGVKLRNITNLSDNIALRLAAASVRIVAPIPGKHAVGIEIPNRNRAIVAFSELINEPAFTDRSHRLPVILGRDIPGDEIIFDLARTPHLLIAGATGSGKSVCVNALICSVLYRHHPSEVKLLLIDPKIVELKLYNDIPHLLTPVITEPKRAFQALQYCIAEMERRYALLDSLGVRDIGAFNRRIRERRLAVEKLPYIVVVVDEFADLMATTGKELEATLARLAAMSRAVGIHLVLATQRPSTDVITGLIKANIPSRIAFMVASKVDSRIIIDGIGAEKLLGRGDMLFVSSWDPFPVRLQGAFLSEDEVERVVDRVKQLGPPDYIDEEIFFDDDDDVFVPIDEDDPLFNRAVEVVVQARKASASYLQRRLKVGYNRAARLIETMEHKGIVGPANGSKPRDILSVPGELDFD